MAVFLAHIGYLLSHHSKQGPDLEISEKMDAYLELGSDAAQVCSAHPGPHLAARFGSQGLVGFIVLMMTILNLTTAVAAAAAAAAAVAAAMFIRNISRNIITFGITTMMMAVMATAC